MSDELDAALERILSDTIAALVSPSPERARMQSIHTLADRELRWGRDSTGTRAILSHDAFKRAEALIAADPAIAKLGPNLRGERPMVSAPSTGGTRFDAGGAVLGVIESAHAEAAVRGLPVNVQTMMTLLRKNLACLRDVATDHSAEILLLLTFSGLHLRSDQELKTPWGVVRSTEDMQDSLGELPDRLRDPAGALRADRAEGREPTAVLIMPLRIPFDVDYSPQPTVRAPAADHASETRERAATLIPLAAVLATYGDDYASPSARSATQIVPWSPGYSGAGSLTARLPFTRATPLTVREVAAAEHWASVLHQRFPASLNVAAGRILSATGLRADKADVLIDSVTAWENVCGSDQGENRFRVTAALSRLLAPLAGDRLTLQKSLGAIYDMRSSIVHGSRPMESRIVKGSEKIPLHYVAALALNAAILALGALLDERPDLLGLSANERADQLILS